MQHWRCRAARFGALHLFKSRAGRCWGSRSPLRTQNGSELNTVLKVAAVVQPHPAALPDVGTADGCGRQRFHPDVGAVEVQMLPCVCDSIVSVPASWLWCCPTPDFSVLSG